MSTDRDTSRIVRSWLEEGATALPDRVLDAVLDQVPATSQRRPWRPARRISEVNNVWKLAIAAAAVVVVAIVGFNFLPNERGITAGPGPSPTPAPTQTPTPTPVPSPSTASNVNATGNFVPGTTYVIDQGGIASGRMTFTVPATGWSAFDPLFVGKNLAGGRPGDGDVFDLYFGPFVVANVYAGGCHWLGTALTPPVGPTVDDLANALLDQAGPGAPPPVAVTLDGHPGKKVELSIPQDLDVSTCDSDGDFTLFGRWLNAGQRYGAAPWTYGNGQHNTVYIIDVDGKRQVIDSMYLPGTSAADRAELDQIIASIRFESQVPSPSAPSPSP